MVPARKVFVRVIAVAIAFLLAAETFARVNGNTGAFSTSIPIRVPAHRGLEPSLALAYNSLGGNGMVGLGWALTGFPVLERQGADGGAPQFDATDSFRLGGEELHPCGASSSPGCVAGGTHFTEHESYQRITYDDVADEWTIDARNGNRSTYSAVFTVNGTGGTTYRWGLTT